MRANPLGIFRSNPPLHLLTIQTDEPTEVLDLNKTITRDRLQSMEGSQTKSFDNPKHQYFVITL